MNRINVFYVLLFIICITLNGQEIDPSQYLELNVEKEFCPLLAAMPVQMETGGAKILKQTDGSLWLVSIGTTTVKPITASELIRRRTVAQTKAKSGAVAELNGASVKSTTIMTTKDTVIIQKGIEFGRSEETLDESIVIEAKGVIKEMPVIGTWLDKTGQIYFLAIGKRIK
jgi:hypothetical protein